MNDSKALSKADTFGDEGLLDLATGTVNGGHHLPVGARLLYLLFEKPRVQGLKPALHQLHLGVFFRVH